MLQLLQLMLLMLLMKMLSFGVAQFTDVSFCTMDSPLRPPSLTAGFNNNP